MPRPSPQYTIVLGGWYQRTTLHLTEIYDFLNEGRSHPELDQSKLNSFHSSLNLKKVTREAGYLEYVLAETEEGITIRYYEDGLYVLQTESSDIKSTHSQLQNYFQNVFEPAISYIFSLGAPIPKVLANIKTFHPVVVTAIVDDPEKLEIDKEKYGPVYSRISTTGVTVYKTPQYIFIAAKLKSTVPSLDLVEMQIFFREFKDQLAKYLDIHRKIWEEIEDIKERKEVSGKDIGPLRARLDAYQKTISLIQNRLNQMGSYVHTRAEIAKSLFIEDHLKTLFQYKFEVLTNTHSYIKEIWAMTKDYLNSAVKVLTDLEIQTTNSSLKSLQIITSIGVLSTILGYLTRPDPPKFYFFGFIYFAILLSATLIVNFTLSRFYKNLKYALKFPDTTTNI